MKDMKKILFISFCLIGHILTAQKISDLPSASSITGAELMEVVQGGTSKKTTAGALVANYVPTARTITINGTVYDLSANRSWSVGNVFTSGVYSNPAWITSLAASKLTGTVSILQGGTGQTTANNALNALLPSQATHAGKVLQTDGTNSSWQATGGGTLASLSDVTLTGLAANDFLKYNGSVWINRTPAQVLSDIGAQPIDSDLTTIAGLTATTDNFLVSVSSAWASRTPAQVRTTLGLDTWTNLVATVTGTAPYRGLGGTYTATGTVTDAFGSNPWLITSGVTTGTGATAGINPVFNSLTSGNGIDILATSGNNYTSGTLLKATVTSTQLNQTVGTNSVGFFSVSGAQANSSRTGIALSGVSSLTGTSSIGVGLFGKSSGATTNYGGYFESSGGTTDVGVVTVNTGNTSSDISFEAITGGASAIGLRVWNGSQNYLRIIGSKVTFGNNANAPYIAATNQAGAAENATGFNLGFFSTATTSGAQSGQAIGHFNFISGYSSASGDVGAITSIVALGDATTYSASSGTSNWHSLYIRPTINQTSSASGTMMDINITTTHTSVVGTKIGINYEPTNTSITGTHYAWRNTSGNFLINGTTITASTVLDVRGIGTTTANIIRLANSANTVRFTLTDAGVGTLTGSLDISGGLNLSGASSPLQVGGSAGTSGQVLTSAGAGATPTWSPVSGWSITGNSGTTAGTNFVGTTDAIDLVFKTNNAENLRITSDGRLYGTALHNSAGAVTGTTNQYIASGTYTPTLTNVANLDGSTAYICQWIRVGNVVTVSGRVSLDQTTTATQTQIRLSLPIASNFSSAEQAGGNATTITTNPYSFAIYADAANNEVVFDAAAPTATTDVPYYFSFTYLIL